MGMAGYGSDALAIMNAGGPPRRLPGGRGSLIGVSSVGIDAGARTRIS